MTKDEAKKIVHSTILKFVEVKMTDEPLSKRDRLLISVDKTICKRIDVYKERDDE